MITALKKVTILEVCISSLGPIEIMIANQKPRTPILIMFKNPLMKS
jgi:hypothetical protein